MKTDSKKPRRPTLAAGTRNLDCPFYDGCLGYLAKLTLEVKDFNCEACPWKDDRREDKLKDELRGLWLLAILLVKLPHDASIPDVYTWVGMPQMNKGQGSGEDTTP